MPKPFQPAPRPFTDPNAANSGIIATQAKTEKWNGGNSPATIKPVATAAAIRIHPEPCFMGSAFTEHDERSTSNQK
jgi:hypothetical protein